MKIITILILLLSFTVAEARIYKLNADAECSNQTSTTQKDDDGDTLKNFTDGKEDPQCTDPLDNTEGCYYDIIEPWYTDSTGKVHSYLNDFTLNFLPIPISTDCQKITVTAKNYFEHESAGHIDLIRKRDYINAYADFSILFINGWKYVPILFRLGKNNDLIKNSFPDRDLYIGSSFNRIRVLIGTENAIGLISKYYSLAFLDYYGGKFRFPEKIMESTGNIYLHAGYFKTGAVPDDELRLQLNFLSKKRRYNPQIIYFDTTGADAQEHTSLKETGRGNPNSYFEIEPLILNRLSRRFVGTNQEFYDTVIYKVKKYFSDAGLTDNEIIFTTQKPEDDVPRIYIGIGHYIKQLESSESNGTITIKEIQSAVLSYSSAEDHLNYCYGIKDLANRYHCAPEFYLGSRLGQTLI